MTRRLSLIAVVAALLVAPVVMASVSVVPRLGVGLVAHEWGTFTSIAGQDGRAVQWLPHTGPTDLPNFVSRINCNPRVKGLLAGMVRMETPVIYFYAPREMTVTVNVRFRQGIITEWFPPPAGVSGDATIDDAFRGDLGWTNVRVLPEGRDEFRVEREPNHYYVARETDAAPLQIGTEHERFLFYRGVGRLPPPIAATVSSEGQIVVRHTRGDALGDVILFENRDGSSAFAKVHTSSPQVTFPPLTPAAQASTPQKYLEDILVAHGLYPMEASAMVRSWEGSWFEHGTRLFYIVSNDAIDAVLPLRIDPRPSEVKRVFVGRLEIATPKTLAEVKSALQRDDRRRLAQYGRFLEPIANRLLSDLPQADRLVLARRIQTASSQWTTPAACQSTTN